MQTSPILVIGATGKTGRRIARQLQDLGENIRAGSRSAPIPFDWDDATTWPAALDGARAAYLSYFPDLACPGAVDRVARLAEMARAAGLQRLVLLSGRGEEHARQGEEAIRASGAPFTLIRAAWFAQNFSEGYLRDQVLAGVIAMPGGDVAEPILDIDDIADVAVAALTGGGHAGQLYEVTGPELLSFADMARELSLATGWPIRHVPITFDEFHDGITEIAGGALGDIFTAIARETLDGRNAWLADGVQRALGRPPRSFRQFASKAAATGAWAAAA